MWVRRSAVIFCTAALVLVSLTGTAAAGDNGGNQEWQGTLVSEIPDTSQYQDCYKWHKCQELRGIAIKDFDVSSVTEGYDEAGFTLYDPSLSGLVTVWHLCMYEEQSGQMELLDCHTNLYYYSEKGGDLHPDSDAVRLMVERGATSEYFFEVAAW